MTTGIFSIGITGLRAAQLGLLTTEHNITNASTPGYSRQRIVQTTNIPVATGSGFVGQGTTVSAIERLYSQTLVNQVNTAQSSVSELDVYYAQIKQIDNMLADQNAGLSPALQDFFRGIQDVAANPALLAARQSMISSAEALVSRFQSMESRLNELYEGVGAQITTTVASINSYAEQIGELNQRIVLAQAGSQQPANDLLDQRDHLMAELNKLVEVRSTVNSDGSYNVFFGTGQQLVVGTQVAELAAQASYADISRIVVGIKTAGAVQELPEYLITGGALAGLVNFRSETLDGVRNDVGRLAATLALTMNAQHSLGQDLLGQVSGEGSFVGNFFTLAQPRVTANTLNTGGASISASFVSPPPINGTYSLALDGAGTTYTLTRQSDGTQWSAGSLAALQAAVPSADGLTLTSAVLAAGQSTTVENSAAATANFYTNLTDSDYRLSYDGANFTLTRLSDNQSWSNASLANLSTTVAASEGFQLAMVGAMAAGDSFTVMPTKFAARDLDVNETIAADPRLIAAAMPLRTAEGATNSGTAKISAGATHQGFTSSSIPAGGLTITYAAGAGTLSFSAGLPAGANISVTVGSTTTVYPAGAAIPYNPLTGATISVAGLSFSISGSPSNNDTFTIARNSAGVADNRNALALGKLQTQSTVAGGSATYQVAYSRLVSDAGNKTREIQVTGDAQSALLKQAEDARDSLSGVNLDEEAANLLRYQQAYQASAKVIDIGSKLFDVILSIRS
ncbi:MAG: flagellar hook-associated protein FlgK [Rhodocyclales bacterium]|nr:flagellar hook-associated protein FlgK [Rhodocyclales bacterium]